MIYYHGGWRGTCSRAFRLSGSLAPKTFVIAIPPALIAGLFCYWFPNGSFQFFGWEEEGILLETQAWSGFSFLVGFLIVFRTSQAYSRFWEGCTASHQMRAEWFDACSSVMSFTKHSHASADETRKFKELLIRLTSMLHAAALADLEKGEGRSPTPWDPAGVLGPRTEEEAWAHSYELIDPESIDAQSLETVREALEPVELLFMWIQQLIVENLHTGVLSIPPPLLSRTFQEFANGMVQFHNAMKIAYIPIPFPYAQTCDWLLLMHALIVPIVTSQWVTNVLWAVVFTLIQVLVLWSLNLVALEIENPFGRDANDMDGRRMQEEMNRSLLLLILPSTQRTPHLSHLFDQRSDEERRQKKSLGSVLKHAKRTRSPPGLEGFSSTQGSSMTAKSDLADCPELPQESISSRPLPTTPKRKKSSDIKSLQISDVKCAQCSGPLTKVEPDVSSACGACAGGAADPGASGSGHDPPGHHPDQHERWFCKQCPRYVCGLCVRALEGPLGTDVIAADGNSRI